VTPSDDLSGPGSAQATIEDMRAEFRAAQQRRNEKAAIAANNIAVAPPAPQTEPPTLATPSRR
jgi:hypothetical protein